MTLICVGLSHKQAPIAVRERLAVAPEETSSRLRPESSSRIFSLRRINFLLTALRSTISPR